MDMVFGSLGGWYSLSFVQRGTCVGEGGGGGGAYAQGNLCLSGHTLERCVLSVCFLISQSIVAG